MEIDLEKVKLVEGWYMPIGEKSVLKKVKSTRAALGEDAGFLIDDYQKGLRERSVSESKGRRVVVDIGAHIGLWSIDLAKQFETVHAFEINPDTFPSLYLNVKERKIENIVIHPCGLGDKNGLVKLTPTRHKSMGTHVVPQEEGEIEIKTLDSFNFKEVDLIKIDVEGYEPYVLLGGIKTIKKCRPIIVMEDKTLHERYGENTPAPSQILKELGMVEIERFRKDVIFGW